MLGNYQKLSVTLFFVLAAGFVLAPVNSSAQSASVYLDRVNNYQSGYIPGWIEAGKEVVWTFGFRNNSGGRVSAVSNGFRVYSPTGATWSPIVFDTLDLSITGHSWRARLDGLFLYDLGSVTGSGADTVAIQGFVIIGYGFENGFDHPVLTISIPSPGIDPSFVGGEVCIDSSFYDVYTWHWSFYVGGLVVDWSGPHCFTIEADCCQGLRADINGDGNDANILDLTFLVDYIFRGSGEPGPCSLEGDVNADGDSANILDLTYVVDRIFRGGPVPVGCP